MTSRFIGWLHKICFDPLGIGGSSTRMNPVQNQWNSSILNQTNLKRTGLTAGEAALSAPDSRPFRPAEFGERPATASWISPNCPKWPFSFSRSQEAGRPPCQVQIPAEHGKKEIQRERSRQFAEIPWFKASQDVNKDLHDVELAAATP